MNIFLSSGPPQAGCNIEFGGDGGRGGFNPTAQMSVLFTRNGKGMTPIRHSTRMYSYSQVFVIQALFSAAIACSNATMAPHLTLAELDFIHEKERAGNTPVETHALLTTQRARHGADTPHLTNIRKALKGLRHKRSRTATRGRNAKYTRTIALKMEKTANGQYKTADSEREVP